MADKSIEYRFMQSGLVNPHPTNAAEASIQLHRSIFFPEKEAKARYVWIPTFAGELPTDLGLWLGSKWDLQYVVLRYKPLPELHAAFRSFDYGDKFHKNRSIENIAGGKTACVWRGPLLVLAASGTLRQVQRADVDKADISDIKNSLRSFVPGPWLNNMTFGENGIGGCAPRLASHSGAVVNKDKVATMALHSSSARSTTDQGSTNETTTKEDSSDDTSKDKPSVETIAAGLLPATNELTAKLSTVDISAFNVSPINDPTADISTSDISATDRSTPNVSTMDVSNLEGPATDEFAPDQDLPSENLELDDHTASRGTTAGGNLEGARCNGMI